MGINTVRIPPHEQSLNEAERIADRAWAAGRTYIADSEEALPTHMALAVDIACYSKLRMATTASRGWLTPAELIKGVRPSISHMVPFFTPAQVTVPKSKRSKLIKQGKVGIRAESGYLVGYMDMCIRVGDVPLTNDQCERAFVGCRAIPELTKEIPTRGPHVAIFFQHHAVVTACSDGHDIACEYRRRKHSAH